MPSLSPNIENRVRKLPKPSNSAQGLLPLFEAVSNAFFGIDDRNDGSDQYNGKVQITVRSLSDLDKIEIEVQDNGIGLDQARYSAFCEVDTDFKSDRGGKGVGRLYWLDAFSRIDVISKFHEQGTLQDRAFSFELSNAEQVKENAMDGDNEPLQTRGTLVKFRGLRAESYRKQFPRRRDTFLRYFSAHFIADFLVGGGAEVVVDLDGDLTSYPSAISDLVVGVPFKGETDEHDEFGKLSIVGYTCKPEASTGLDGTHQLHLLANGRTVEPRKIDQLLAVLRIERDGDKDLVFHGCVSGKYLDQHVNEGRTAFNLKEAKIKELCRYCAEHIKKTFLEEQMKQFEKERKDDYQDFVRRYPIYGFADEETQLGRVPFAAREPEDFATGLVKYQIRRDERRQSEIERVIGLLEDDDTVTEGFAETLQAATKEIQDSERLALAQHVVRRKLVLELLETLIRKIRARGEKEEDYHLESTLHSFIVPMRIQGDDPNRVEATAHDLWIVDERLAFTRSFSSDQRLNQTIKQSDSAGRPDLFVWNLAHGLGVVDPKDAGDELDISEPLKKVMIVEFKRPGRTQYQKVEDQIEHQITKYLRQLKGGDVESFSQQKVRIAKDCLFHCYVIADITGDLEDQLGGWPTTANGEGRIRSLDNEFKGSTIEVVQWQDLVNDAWMRNEATINAAGLSRAKKLR
ncbi:ATP-binding protein [uncultured Litoreibacter sp.]|uniref:ATP-binding protein n=1 Tax=uncultured Litoreibacter sp. TaxID=1392394 RepID=UPI0026200D79|nr:ATP-binding protein [uncultured Litoreibacter sp.]